MYFWVLLLLNILIKDGYASSEAQHYECGSHGRFEYCIDGIPGCVIGCHCYPGYYFDTETKICEPNIKLANDYRRHFFVEPTRLPLLRNEPSSTPTTTTVNAVIEKVNSITQDADDLGDWLYNQFFKTIENQVINETGNEPLTRRSGSPAARPIPIRRSHRKSRKKWKRRRGDKGRKNKGLRRKLLRITEDDSLFNSDSDTDSGSMSSSSESNSDSSDKHDRRILMMNKKKTSPLPSFVFLPNAETPYYPPIGLPPPPPILPMYPMIPVPPVAPIIIHVENATTTTTSEPKTTTEPPTTTTTEAPEEPETESNTDNTGRKYGRQNKMMRMRNKMRKRNKTPHMDPLMNQFQSPETPYFNENGVPPSVQFRSRPDIPNNEHPLEDVDFKYLSQLIHKMDTNKPKPNMPFKPSLNRNNLNQQLMMRRSYETHNRITTPQYIEQHKLPRPVSKADDVNDSYYSNLGKQIASLIRKVDTKGEVDIEIQKDENMQNPLETMFNQNSYSPRSYWERFVRSPFKRKVSYFENNNNLKQSNENLSNIEDQVNIAAAIEKSLNLNELENIANIMKLTQSKPPRVQQRSKRPGGPPTGQTQHFDINLWPLMRKQNDIKPFELPRNTYNYDKNTSTLQETIKGNIFNAPASVSPRTMNLESIIVNGRLFKNNNTFKHSLNFSNNITKQELLRKLMKSPLITPLHHQVSRIVHGNITESNANRHVIKYQLNPMMLNYKSFKYFNSHNQYRSQQAIIPFPKYTPNTYKSTGTNGRPSLIHHEFHHFDFFN